MEIIILFVNVLIGAFVWYRLGRQSVFNDLYKYLQNVIRDNEDKEIIIKTLKSQLNK